MTMMGHSAFTLLAALASRAIWLARARSGPATISASSSVFPGEPARLVIRYVHAGREQPVADRLGIHIGELLGRNVMKNSCPEGLHLPMERARVLFQLEGLLDRVPDDLGDVGHSGRQILRRPNRGGLSGEEGVEERGQLGVSPVQRLDLAARIHLREVDLHALLAVQVIPELQVVGQDEIIQAGQVALDGILHMARSERVPRAFRRCLRRSA